MNVEIRADEQFYNSERFGEFVLIDHSPPRDDVDRVDYYFVGMGDKAVFHHISLHRHQTAGMCEDRDGDADDLEPWVFHVVMDYIGLPLKAEAPDHVEKQVEENIELDDPVEIDIS